MPGVQSSTKYGGVSLQNIALIGTFGKKTEFISSLLWLCSNWEDKAGIN
jgi:hypothetical protein